MRRVVNPVTTGWPGHSNPVQESGDKLPSLKRILHLLPVIASRSSQRSHRPTSPCSRTPLACGRTPDGALAKYNEQKDTLHAGKKPREPTEGTTVKDAVNAFLNHLSAHETSRSLWIVKAAAAESRSRTSALPPAASQSPLASAARRSWHLPVATRHTRRTSAPARQAQPKSA